MRRRDFIALLGSAAAAWPLAARAQQGGRIHRLGVLIGLPESDLGGQAEVAELRRGLRDLGWREGDNLRVDYRWSGADRERARVLAKEIVGLAPDVIIARSTPAAAALKAETHTIPIVFMQVAEPTVSGLVEGLSHPGGNITGFTNYEASIGGKWLQLLKEIAPQVVHVTIIFNPDTAPYARSFVGPAEMAAATLGMDVSTALIRSEADIQSTITAMAVRPGSGLIVIPDTFVNEHRELVVGLAARYRVPAIYSNSAASTTGPGLIVYNIDSLDISRRAAAYVDKIIKGEKPGDLPVQQPTKFRLTINLEAAMALGLTVPPSLLAIADEVIE
jgi:putative ABC transport system substrate-binding protein